MFSEFEILSRYTREQAIDDGVLVDASEMATEAGIRYPVALFAEVITPDERAIGQSIDGRLWDALWLLHCAITGRIRAKRYSMGVGEAVEFSCLFVMQRAQRHRLTLRAIVGPGDSAEPVITLERV